MAVPKGYTNARLLGSGAYGSVYYAKAPDGSECALKAIDIFLATSWKTETDILCRLNHPNIVSFQKAFKDKNTLWLQLEYCSGGSLQDLFNRKKISGSLKYKFMKEISSALDYLHKQGIAHRDIKPDNVLIKPESDGTLTAKLADFGIAKILVKEKYDGDYMKYYMQSGYRGTSYFMAPEIMDKNEKGYNLQVDIFSLGILYIALVGETTLQIGSKKYLIFHCDDQPVGEVIHQTKQNVEVSKGTIKNDTLRSLLNRMIKRNYHERPLAGEVLSTISSNISEKDL